MLSGGNDLMATIRWSRRLSPKALQALGKVPATRPIPRGLECH